MDAQPSVSVIIVSYNSADCLPECLDSLAPIIASGVEVIVTDNASTDDSCAVVRDRYPAVKLIEAGGNLGFAAGCNLGAAQSSGELLVFLNPDTVVEPGWLAGLLQAYEADPAHTGIVMPQIVLYDAPDRLNTCGNALHYLGFCWCPDYRKPRLAASEPFGVAIASGACFLMPRALFERLSGFDDDYFLYHEDVDLSWRTRLAGFDIICAPASVVRHRYTFSLPPWKRALLERNRIITCLKNYELRTLVLLAPLALLAETWLWAGETLTGHPLLRPRAYAQVLRRMSAIRAKRQACQAMRGVGDRELRRWMGARLPQQVSPKSQ